MPASKKQTTVNPRKPPPPKGRPTVVGVNYTYDDEEGNSMSVGASLGVGSGMSVGLRDSDKDGKTEVCASGSIEGARIGVCVELP